MASSFLQKIKNVGRLTYIINVFAKYGFSREIKSSGLSEYIKKHSLDKEHNEDFSVYRRLVLAFEELGPTFVKLGQLLAVREDLLPKEAIIEFKRLQDKVKPISKEGVENLLNKEFGEEKSNIFLWIDDKVLGSASIGQVHKAKLFDGSDVVIKVQRPGIEEIIKNDLSILMGIASFLEMVLHELRGLKPTGIIEELSRSLFTELDYFREAAQTERLRIFFTGHENVYIPKVFRKYSTKKVLCLEEIKGKKIYNIENNFANKDIVKIGVNAFLDMVFKLGTFHADLHPGNFLILEDRRLVILDFGITARISRELRKTLTLMFFALIKEDLETFSHLFLELTEMKENVDIKKLENSIRDIVDILLSVPSSELQIGKLFIQVARICASNNAPVNRDLFMFFRALLALEAFGKTLDKDFQLLELATKYSQTLPKPSLNPDWLESETAFILRDIQLILKEFPQALRMFSKRSQQGMISLNVKSEELSLLAQHLDKASKRISLAIILAALVLGGSVITFGKTGHFFDYLSTFGLFFFVIAVFIGLWIILGFLRSGNLRE